MLSESEEVALMNQIKTSTKIAQNWYERITSYARDDREHDHFCVEFGIDPGSILHALIDSPHISMSQIIDFYFLEIENDGGLCLELGDRLCESVHKMKLLSLREQLTLAETTIQRSEFTSRSRHIQMFVANTICSEIDAGPDLNWIWDIETSYQDGLLSPEQCLKFIALQRRLYL
ncbi:MAG: hypothetical protein AAGA35_04155 [Patescibacteria group bacterium]